jgi:hypothetical protein
MRRPRRRFRWEVKEVSTESSCKGFFVLLSE